MEKLTTLQKSTIIMNTMYFFMCVFHCRYNTISDYFNRAMALQDKKNRALIPKKNGKQLIFTRMQHQHTKIPGLPLTHKIIIIIHRNTKNRPGCNLKTAKRVHVYNSERLIVFCGKLEKMHSNLIFFLNVFYIFCVVSFINEQKNDSTLTQCSVRFSREFGNKAIFFSFELNNRNSRNKT